MQGKYSMGIGDKMKFWKKSDDLGLGDDLGIPETGSPPAENVPGMLPPQPPPDPVGNVQMPRIDAYHESRNPYTPQQQAYPNRDMELIAAKLDALKATLENINQRLAGLERVAYAEDEKRNTKEW